MAAGGGLSLPPFKTHARVCVEDAGKKSRQPTTIWSYTHTTATIPLAIKSESVLWHLFGPPKGWPEQKEEEERNLVLLAFGKRLSFPRTDDDV